MDLQTLIGKALNDKTFAKSLIENPEKTLGDAGVEATPEMLKALKNIDVEALKNLAVAFGEEKSAH